MPGPAAMRAGPSARGWPIASAGAALLALMTVVEAAALAWSSVALADLDTRARSLATLALLVALAIGFEEGARRAARLQIRLSSHLRSDMTSVWIVTGAVALSPGHAVILLVALFSYVWFRQQRPAGEALYRKIFTTCTALLACLTAGVAFDVVANWCTGLPWALAGSIPVLVAIVSTTVVARLLITGALLSIGVRGKDLLGTRHDNLIELATLCLGGLVALAVVHEPWLAILVVAPMVTLQRGALVSELEAAAMTDAKTGLLNAVAWEQLAQRELVRAERESSSVAVLLIDIDRFKTVNDHFGHLVGDQVLRGVGRSIGGALRAYDGLGRFGGEEFVAVLPQADEHAALVVAERVRARINETSIAQLANDSAEPSAAVLSVSIGVACRPTDGRDLPDLLHVADQALYRAKGNGRNQVQLAHRGDGTPERITAI